MKKITREIKIEPLSIFWILEAEMLNNTFWFINPKRSGTEKKKTNKPPNV